VQLDVQPNVQLALNGWSQMYNQMYSQMCSWLSTDVPHVQSDVHPEVQLDLNRRSKMLTLAPSLLLHTT
jgi:hypothetical protein